MTPTEANNAVIEAIKIVDTANRAYETAVITRDDALSKLEVARQNLEDVLRLAAGLDARYMTHTAEGLVPRVNA